MWVLKLLLDSRKQPMGRLCIKNKVSISGYPLSYYKKDGKIYYVGVGFVVGEEANKKAFIKDLRAHPYCQNLEFANDFAVVRLVQPFTFEPFLNPELIRLEPSIINWKTKQHMWHLASFDKKVLAAVYDMAKKHLGATLLKFKQEPITNISIMQALPELTAKQKRALEVAINSGYYDYPKKINMEALAKDVGVAYSTFQAHLKKAEGKLLPSIYKQL